MKAFELVDARSAEEAVALLARLGPRAQLLASGADVLYLRKDGIAGPAMSPPEVLIDLGAARGLAGIRQAPDGGLVIGAMTRLCELLEHPVVAERYGLLAQAAAEVASPQLRNTSTVGGNLCQRPRCWYFRHPDVVCLKKGGSTCWAVEGDNRYYHAILEGGPCHIVHPSDLAPALLALEATARILGPGGERRVALEAFFVSTRDDLYRENVLAADEVIVGLELPPAPAGRRQVFLKASVRQTGEFALASVAVATAIAGGRLRGCRVALGGVAPRPLRALAAEAALEGREPTPATLAAAAAAAVAGARPMSMNAYKVELLRNLVRRALGLAAG
jgi:xanthine dehydrogenase YagS FAD-binding subunit